MESYESFQICEPVKSLQKVLSAQRKVMQEEGQTVPRRGYRMIIKGLTEKVAKQEGSKDFKR